MDIYKEILDQLKKEYSDGATYQEMSSKYGVSYQYLREIVQGIKKTDRMSLGVFFKLFPNAQIILNGDHISGTATAENGNAIVGHHNHVTAPAESSAEAFRSKAIAAMIDLDIPADALREVLKTLKDLQG